MLKPCAAEKYIYFDGEDTTTKKEVLKIVKRIGKGIEHEIVNNQLRNDSKSGQVTAVNAPVTVTTAAVRRRISAAFTETMSGRTVH